MLKELKIMLQMYMKATELTSPCADELSNVKLKLCPFVWLAGLLIRISNCKNLCFLALASETAQLQESRTKEMTRLLRRIGAWLQHPRQAAQTTPGTAAPGDPVASSGLHKALHTHDMHRH